MLLQWARSTCCTPAVPHSRRRKSSHHFIHITHYSERMCARHWSSGILSSQLMGWLLKGPASIITCTPGPLAFPTRCRHLKCTADGLAAKPVSHDPIINRTPAPPPNICSVAGILNAQLMGWLPRGAALINGARGRHLVEPDLLATMQSGQVSYSLLNVLLSLNRA